MRTVESRQFKVPVANSTGRTRSLPLWQGFGGDNTVIGDHIANVFLKATKGSRRVTQTVGDGMRRNQTRELSICFLPRPTRRLPVQLAERSILILMRCFLAGLLILILSPCAFAQAT